MENLRENQTKRWVGKYTRSGRKIYLQEKLIFTVSRGNPRNKHATNMQQQLKLHILELNLLELNFPISHNIG